MTETNNPLALYSVSSKEEMGQVLARARENLGYSQNEFAQQISMPQQQYHPIESGSNISLRTLLRIAEGLQLELVMIPKSILPAVKLPKQKTAATKKK